ncbi:unnamed protein product [Oikopleura dioica]|uniref:RBR-type E3 ubiquitin transferase n=1 Tax=Oikopleura dioica TaxID=34765 RepID=E4YZZ2_OIKDI|nr:unnamed protein product [Oikopleura dioica]
MDGEDLVEDEVVLVSIIDKNDGKRTVLHVSKNSSINDILVMSEAQDSRVILSGIVLQQSSLLSDLFPLESYEFILFPPESRGHVLSTYLNSLVFGKPETHPKLPEVNFAVCRECVQSSQSPTPVFSTVSCSICHEFIISSKPRCSCEVTSPTKNSFCSKHQRDQVIIPQLRIPQSFILQGGGSSNLCCVCFDEIFLEPVVVFQKNERPCHVTCLSCYQRYSEISIKERKTPALSFTSSGVIISCPTCDAVHVKTWQPQILRLFGETLYDLYGVMSTDFFLSKQENRIFCPKQTCGCVFLVETIEGGIITCPVCIYQFCVYCKEIAHEGDCPSIPKNDVNSKYYIKNMKKCPDCKTPAEKISGCNHMTCQAPFCDTEWCWVCCRRWSLDCQLNHWGLQDPGTEIH